MRYDDRFVFSLAEEEKLVKSLNCSPYYQDISSGADLYVRINGRMYLNLASNNYLNLAKDPEIIRVMKLALDEYGASMCGTPVACGKVDIYQNAVDAITGFLGLEDAVLYPSCYQANVSAIGTLVTPEDIVFVDRNAHSSILEGIKASGCKIKPFRHNDMEHLGALLRGSGSYYNRFIATESVFSTEGSIAPFDRIYELALEFDAVPIVDDSHGIGVIGRTGKGILEEKKIADFEGIYTVSTGKALGISGGFVCGSKKLMELLRYTSSGLLYSTAIPPTLIAGTIKALEIVQRDGETMVRALKANKEYLYTRLKEQDFHLCEGEASICSMVTGTNERTFRIHKSLFEEGIMTTPFVYPSVGRDRGVLRMIPRIDLAKEDLDRVILAFCKIRDAHPEWFD